MRRKVTVDLDHLLEWQSILRTVDLRCDDFEEVIDSAVSGDFIVVDPPYFGQFSNYCANGFSQGSHVRLARALNRATRRGVKWMAFNSPEAENMYRRLKNSVVKIIDSRTLIDRHLGNSGSKEELFVTNY